MKRFFKMLSFWRWEMNHPIGKSRHLKDYEEIASVYGLDRRVVYGIAHGMLPDTQIESHVVNELIQRGILK